MTKDKESEDTFKPFKTRTVHDHHPKAPLSEKLVTYNKKAPLAKKSLPPKKGK